MANLITGPFTSTNTGLLSDFSLDIFKMSSTGDDTSGIQALPLGCLAGTAL